MNQHKHLVWTALFPLAFVAMIVAGTIAKSQIPPIPAPPPVPGKDRCRPEVLRADLDALSNLVDHLERRLTVLEMQRPLLTNILRLPDSLTVKVDAQVSARKE